MQNTLEALPQRPEYTPDSRMEELLAAFRRLGNPLENESSPLEEILRFPGDLPYLQRILSDHYHVESWLLRQDEAWIFPIYAWRGLALEPDPSSVPVLLECLIMAGFDDDEWGGELEYEEIPPILAAHGEALLAPLEEMLRNELQWGRDADAADAMLDALNILVEQKPELGERADRMALSRLEEYRYNAPLLNAALLAYLAQRSCRKCLPLARTVYGEDFCDEEFLPWGDFRENFPEENLPAAVSRLTNPNRAFQQEPYVGEDRLARLLRAADMQGRLDIRKGLVLGSILSPGAASPASVMKEFFTDPFTEEEQGGGTAIWQTEGQGAFCAIQFFHLWNELADFQDKLFPLRELLPSAEEDARLRMMVLGEFLAHFLDGLLLDLPAAEQAWVESHPFVSALEKRIEELRGRDELYEPEGKEEKVAELLALWGESYIPFTLDVKARRIEFVQRAQARSSSPGRNDPCPCGSGKKFKKCCLQ
jgi:uncharacterized protein YecA (UPF0149 family)